MLDEATIVAASSAWRDLCGVYFIVVDGRVRYVGQARHVYARLAVHAREKEPFERVTVIECSPSDLDVIESFYIHRLRPEWNAKRGDTMVAPLRMTDLYKNRSVEHE